MRGYGFRDDVENSYSKHLAKFQGWKAGWEAQRWRTDTEMEQTEPRLGPWNLGRVRVARRCLILVGLFCGAGFVCSKGRVDSSIWMSDLNVALKL